jgi:hypothetical protein
MIRESAYLIVLLLLSVKANGQTPLPKSGSECSLQHDKAKSCCIDKNAESCEPAFQDSINKINLASVIQPPSDQGDKQAYASVAATHRTIGQSYSDLSATCKNKIETCKQKCQWAISQVYSSKDPDNLRRKSQYQSLHDECAQDYFDKAKSYDDLSADAYSKANAESEEASLLGSAAH